MTETKEIAGKWHKERQILAGNDPEIWGENLGVSIEGKFVVLESFGTICSMEHNTLYEKYDRIAALIAAAPEMYALLDRIKGMLEMCRLEQSIDAETEHEIDSLLAKAQGAPESR